MKHQEEEKNLEEKELKKLNAQEALESQAKRKKREKKKGRKSVKKKARRSLLTFEDEMDDELEEVEEGEKEVKTSGDSTCKDAREVEDLIKNPEVETGFLPDRKKEAQEKELTKQKHKEWLEEQIRFKKESLEVTYSFYDGKGRRYKLLVTKGCSIREFLGKARQQLLIDYPELKRQRSSDLIFVKKDLIMPSDITFSDLLLREELNIRFDVKEDVRLVSDPRVKSKASHAAKVCLRSWYEKHKHIYPATKWTAYLPPKGEPRK